MVLRKILKEISVHRCKTFFYFKIKSYSHITWIAYKFIPLQNLTCGQICECAGEFSKFWSRNKWGPKSPTWSSYKGWPLCGQTTPDPGALLPVSQEPQTKKRKNVQK